MASGTFAEAFSKSIACPSSPISGSGSGSRPTTAFRQDCKCLRVVFGPYSVWKRQTGSPAEPVFDSFENLHVEALQDPSTLAVIPICDLFQNLAEWKGKRVAVRGSIVSTFEGSWITGSCDDGFVTNGYRWPISLNYGIPAYYSSKTARLYDPKWPTLPNGEDFVAAPDQTLFGRQLSWAS